MISSKLQEGNYPNDTQGPFLELYRSIRCAQLGNPPDEKSTKSGVGWDGNCKDRAILRYIYGYIL